MRERACRADFGQLIYRNVWVLQNHWVWLPCPCILLTLECRLRLLELHVEHASVDFFRVEFVKLHCFEGQLFQGAIYFWRREISDIISLLQSLTHFKQRIRPHHSDFIRIIAIQEHDHHIVSVIIASFWANFCKKRHCDPILVLKIR